MSTFPFLNLDVQRQEIWCRNEIKMLCMSRPFSEVRFFTPCSFLKSLSSVKVKPRNGWIQPRPKSIACWFVNAWENECSWDIAKHIRVLYLLRISSSPGSPVSRSVRRSPPDRCLGSPGSRGRGSHGLFLLDWSGWTDRTEQVVRGHRCRRGVHSCFSSTALRQSGLLNWNLYSDFLTLKTEHNYLIKYINHEHWGK